MNFPPFRKNNFYKNLTVNIINSQINGNNIDVRSMVNRVDPELPQPEPPAFLDMGPEHNRQYIEAFHPRKKGR